MVVLAFLCQKKTANFAIFHFSLFPIDLETTYTAK